jgi:hypothetical protein
VAALPLAAGTISLSWDPVTHPQLAGYRVYYGTSPGSYGADVDAGLNTQITLNSLSDCTTYYVAIKSYDTTNRLSTTYSNEVTGWSRPVVTAVGPTSLQRGVQSTLTIDGANFQPGASVVLGNPGITVGSPSVTSCSRLTVPVTVGAQAALGASSVMVVNPDQVYGSAASLFSVIADAAAPTLSAVQAGPVGATTAMITWTTNEPATSQVFFRRVGQSAYQQTPASAALTDDHAVTLHGLSPESAYQFYVRSADASGNAATSNPALSFTTLASSFTYLRFEAESGTLTAPAVSVSGTGAFAAKWLSLPSGTATGTHTAPSGMASFGFLTPYDATWRVWVRMYGPSTGSDGWLESVNDTGYDYVYPTQTGQWEWVEARTYDLAEGLHQFRLGGHEALARVDRVLITDDPNFVPSEQPGDDVTPPQAVSALAASAGNATVELSWTDPASDATQIVIRFRTDGSLPVSPVDGMALVSTAAVPGSAGSFEHTGLSNGTTYRYAVFAIDAAGNASAAATVSATPESEPPDPVDNLRRTDTM